MQVEDHQVGSVLACQLDGDARLHGREQADVGPQGEDGFDQRDRGQVVLDIEDCPSSDGVAQDGRRGSGNDGGGVRVAGALQADGERGSLALGALQSQ